MLKLFKLCALGVLLTLSTVARSGEALEDPALGCRRQNYLTSLDVGNYYALLDQKKPSEAVAFLKAMTSFRATHYGRVLTEPSTFPYNTVAVGRGVAKAKFLGFPIAVHSKIVAPLHCVEEAILESCVGSDSYAPKNLSAYREKNTYPGVISNHNFGLAVDFDPMPAGASGGNPCCGPMCARTWSANPVCTQHDTAKDDPFEIAKIPRCWVRAFEFYGFHWLVNYKMHDVMHFEFLGDPDKIVGSDRFIFDPNEPILSVPNRPF